MKKLVKIVLICALAAVTATLAACGGGGTNGPSRGSRKELNIMLRTDSSSRKITDEIQQYYNRNVAKGYSIKFNYVPGASSGSGTALSTGATDIAEANDKVLKGYAVSKYVMSLDKYIDDGTIDVSDMSDSSVDRFRLNTETGEVGKSAPLYAVPFDNAPTALFYNATALKKEGISIISIAEDELDAYNKANGTSYLPHGYYEYATAPAAGSNLRVFNDQIPTSWEEMHTLGRLLSQKYNKNALAKYGFYSEWWFNYGWSVGGDCLENTADGKLKFTLADDTPNYLVTKDTEINGNAYKAGELLGYLDKVSVAAGGGENDALYPFPSQRDAFSEFCALSQREGVNVTSDGKFKGYEISPNPTALGNTDHAAALYTGLCAIVAMGIDESFAVTSSMKTKGYEWGIAPFPQWREYNADGTMKTINGTAVKGVEASHNLLTGFVISSKTRYPDECAEFIGWWTSEEGQKRIIASGTRISCLNSLNADPECQSIMKDAFGCTNIGPIVNLGKNAMQGDWSYVEDGNWITDWALDLNTKVRDGVKTVDRFWTEWEAKTDAYLAANYKTKKFR